MDSTKGIQPTASIQGEKPAEMPTPHRILELDGLRGTAILLVIVCHYIADADHRPLGFVGDHLYTVLTVGWSGVDLFFVLSGFLIGGILLDARNSSNYFRTFYLRRVHRILPIYYLLIGLYVVVVVLSASPWFRPVVVNPPGQILALNDLSVVPKYVLFLQNVLYSPRPFEWIWFVVTWSLAVEEQFYLVAPPLIRFLSERTLIVLLCCTVFFAPLIRFVTFVYFPHLDHFAQFAMPCRADALSLGILGAILWRSPRIREYLQGNTGVLQRSTLYLLVCLIGLLWWLARPLNTVMITAGYSFLGLFYASLLLLVLFQPGSLPARIMRSPVLRWLGMISYCVYLFHDLINQLAHRIFLRNEPSLAIWSGIFVTASALGVTLLFAVLSWKFFEKPLVRRGHRFSYD
jgi:peptidoglycan/LPS O-acetylase OafA/YrhL